MSPAVRPAHPNGADHTMIHALSRPRLAAAALTALAALLLAFALAAPSAHASFGFVPGSVSADAFKADGSYETQAGAHPFEAVTDFKLNNYLDAGGTDAPDEQLRDLVVDLPQGFVGNPQAGPTCSWQELKLFRCPTDAQVGFVNLDWIPINPPRGVGQMPLYNMETTEGHVAEFGFLTSLGVNQLVASVRPGDNGIRIRSNRSPEGLVFGAKVTLWGVPGDPAHDQWRGIGATCQSGAPCPAWTPVRFNSAIRPFLTNPTSCGGPLTTTFTARSWEHPERWVTATATTARTVDGCEHLRFDPTMTARTDVRTPDAPSGFTVTLGVPQSTSYAELARSTLRDAKVTLPEGMTVNPAAAGGLGACSDADLKLLVEEPATCPENAKIGTLEIDTPLVRKTLKGNIYVGRQTPSQLLRMFLVVNDQGVTLKIPGTVDPDPVTGRLVATFKNNPQLPFSTFTLSFKSGPRAPLATPTTCGPKTTVAELTPWSGGATKTVTDTFTIDCPGVSGFAPAFRAGSVAPTAGAFSPFVLRIDRPDGQQNLKNVTVTLPPGLLAKLRGVPLCASDAAAAGTCASASRVGTATVAAGPGASPFYLRDQPVYLSGPYGDAPYSLAVVARAIAGPFDLGTVVVRQRLLIDPVDAHVTVVSDPLPTILKGIPLRLRSVDVDVDRPGFTVNPTSCAAKRISAVLGSEQGLSAAVDTRFQATGCDQLDLQPRLGLTLSGKGQTTDGKHPAISAHLTMPRTGQANLKRVRVTLPLSLALDPENSQSDTMCEFDVGRQTIPDCPASSIIGQAKAVSPLLDEPLSGPVYFVKNVRIDAKSGRRISTLPTLAIPLRGGGITLVLRATTATPDNQHLVTTFDNIPDAAVSDFMLNINGGKKGILVVTGGAKTDICAASQVAQQEVDGQNAKAADADIVMQTSSCPTKVIKKKVGRKAVTLKVGGLGTGRLTVAGRGIKKATRSITRSTVATITAKRTKGAVGKVKVAFDPAGPAKVRTATR